MVETAFMLIQAPGFSERAHLEGSSFIPSQPIPLGPRDLLLRSQSLHSHEGLGNGQAERGGSLGGLFPWVSALPSLGCLWAFSLTLLPVTILASQS